MVQWFGNLVMEMPVGLPVVTQTGKGRERGVGQLELLVIVGCGWENIASKLPPWTCWSSIRHTKTTLYHFAGWGPCTGRRICFAGRALLVSFLVEITPVSAQLKEVQLMLHLSVPIVNSVDSLPLLPKMPVFVYLLFCLFVCACKTVAGKRNECLWVIRPVGEEEEKDEQRKWETDSNGGERGRESSLITHANTQDHTGNHEHW